jgi:hypothetical protein
MGKHKPKPLTAKQLHLRKTKKNAHRALLAIAQKARRVTEKRDAVQGTLAENGEIYKMIHNDDKGLNKANHPFINSFDSLKGIHSPPYTERSQEIQNMINRREKHLKNRSNRHEKMKKIRQAFIERKTGVDTRDEVFKHPYENRNEKKTRRRPKKRAPVTSSIQTRSMRRSQEMLTSIPESNERQMELKPTKPRPTPKYRGRKPKTTSESEPVSL